MDLIRKGISPLIASVLLLAFVMAIFGIFSEWGGELVMDSTDQNTDAQEDLLNCNNKRIEIVSISEDYGSNSLEVTLRAHGGMIGNITVTAFPSLERGYINLTSDTEVKSTTLSVGSQQDRISVDAQSCPLSTEEELGN